MTDADYLEHTILFGAVQSCLKNRQQPLRILDLGCGDCQNLAKLIKALPEGTVASYTGQQASLHRLYLHYYLAAPHVRSHKQGRRRMLFIQ